MSQNVPSEKRSLLALALASGTSITDAAEQAGISRKTVQRYLARPAFRRLVARQRAEMLASALGRMTDNMSRAADTVASLLDGAEPHIRLRAARTLLSLGLRLQDAVDVDERVRELERELARRRGEES
jgi:hypothetical protein